MKNKRQRQFRKLMREAEHTRTQSIKDPVYSYKERQFENEKSKRRYKRPIIQIGGVISLLVLMWNLYSFSAPLLPWTDNKVYISANQLEVHQYIQKSTEIELALNSQVSSLINQYNENSLTELHIEEAQKEIFKIQNKLETNDKRFVTLNSYLEEQFSLAFQVTNILKATHSKVKYQELVDKVENQKTLSTSKNKILISLLESEGIPYQQHEDGTISYEYEI